LYPFEAWIPFEEYLPVNEIAEPKVIVFPVTLAKAIGLKVRNSPDNSAMLSLKILILSPLIRIKAVPKWKCHIDFTSGLDLEAFIYPNGKQRGVLYQKDLKKSRKKCFSFVNSSFVYETCGNFQSLLTGRTISDTYKFLDSRFRGNDNFLQIHHKSLINPEAIVLVAENNSRIEQAFPSAGATFP
jgi:hypothetical protein